VVSFATIRSVAELAGVSTATVSRTLAHPERVAEATRTRVLEAVHSTGFVPNRQAVNFRRRATQNIILLVRDIANPFYLDIYRGVEELAFANGYRVLMGDSRFDDARLLRYVDMVRNRHADGLILMTGWLPEGLTEASLPTTVVASELVRDSLLPTVSVDNRSAAHLAVDHLIGLGHRRIAHLSGPTRLVMSADRHGGYLDALAGAGIGFDPALALVGDFHFASGAESVTALLDAGIDFTALFCDNDEMAIGAIRELRRRGLCVPTDVSVVGFDDMDYAASSDPGLTTVRQRRHEIGRRAMQMLVDLLAGHSLAGQREEIEVELVIRDSTAPAKR
jgi:LacI family repressor for deo operon, udp, cdd, tsx, nupC, and nupG